MTAVIPVAAPGTAGRRERRKARTRRALLDAALGLFARHGIHGTRLEDITDAADLGKGAFYNYFGSKTELVSSLLDEAVAGLLSACDDHIRAHDEPAARVTAMVRAHDAYFKRHPACFLLIHQARGLLMRHDADDEPLARVFQEYLAGLGRLLAPPDAPEMGPVARADLAAAVAGAVSGYRSFDVAAGLPGQPGTIETFVNGGVAAALARSAGSAATSP